MNLWPPVQRPVQFKCRSRREERPIRTEVCHAVYRIETDNGDLLDLSRHGFLPDDLHHVTCTQQYVRQWSNTNVHSVSSTIWSGQCTQVTFGERTGRISKNSLDLISTKIRRFRKEMSMWTQQIIRWSSGVPMSMSMIVNVDSSTSWKSSISRSRKRIWKASTRRNHSTCRSWKRFICSNGLFSTSIVFTWRKSIWPCTISCSPILKKSFQSLTLPWMNCSSPCTKMILFHIKFKFDRTMWTCSETCVVSIPRVCRDEWNQCWRSISNDLDIDKLVSLTGMVIRSSLIMPEMRSAYFSCNTCSFHVQVEIDRGRISEPTVCTSCNTAHSFELIHNRSLFADKQFIKLQETPGLSILQHLSEETIQTLFRGNAGRSNTSDRHSRLSQWFGRCCPAGWSVNDVI